MTSPNHILNSPTLIGKGFKVVPVTRDHFPTLHKWYSDPESLYLWTNRREILSEMEYCEAFSNWLRNYFHIYLIVVDKKDMPIGFVYSYEANLIDGYVYVTTYIVPERRQTGIGAKVTMLFQDYLFSYYPIRKIYCDVFEYNKHSLSNLKRGGFKEEGAFKKHRFFRGKYYTLYRMAMYREEFYERFGLIISRL